jgi:hypothetical protein
MNEINAEYIIKENQLIIRDSTLRFDFPIGEYIEISDMLIICLKKPVDILYNENVFGVNLKEKKIKWQIAKKEYNSNMKSCPFVGMKFFKGQLILYNWCDVYFVVNPVTGDILEEGWTR